MRAAICNALKYSSLAAVIAIAGANVAAAQERVTWTEQANVAVRGNTLEKTRGCDGCGDAGATSTQVIESNGGYVEFRIPRTRRTWWPDWPTARAAPGSRTSSSASGSTATAGRTSWRAAGHRRRHDYQAGDTFRIEVVNNRVRYLRNGELDGDQPEAADVSPRVRRRARLNRRLRCERAHRRGEGGRPGEARRPRRVPYPRSK